MLFTHTKQQMNLLFRVLYASGGVKSILVEGRKSKKYWGITVRYIERVVLSTVTMVWREALPLSFFWHALGMWTLAEINSSHVRMRAHMGLWSIYSSHACVYNEGYRKSKIIAFVCFHLKSCGLLMDIQLLRLIARMQGSIIFCGGAKVGDDSNKSELAFQNILLSVSSFICKLQKVMYSGSRFRSK